ncbi:hypothetical protein Y032_0055g2604 [Ancylostoma ceylanicum]|uniref:Uncharacterized protein n=1 Tax=Ancylostoma ceylanicum TaxID=53326 RepID=A0A016U5E6_9BILA|nr:hypothetical protein Y032_0055g2604 [Ancylostoma ceylanicum]
MNIIIAKILDNANKFITQCFSIIQIDRLMNLLIQLQILSPLVNYEVSLCYNTNNVTIKGNDLHKGIKTKQDCTQ